jgi:hypothetical protein
MSSVPADNKQVNNCVAASFSLVVDKAFCDLQVAKAHLTSKDTKPSVDTDVLAKHAHGSMSSILSDDVTFLFFTWLVWIMQLSPNLHSIVYASLCPDMCADVTNKQQI